jgi:hypothetical protein
VRKPGPATRNPEPIDSGKSLAPVLAGAVALTLLAAGVALSMALRSKAAKPTLSAAVPSAADSALLAPGEIDVSDWPTSAAKASDSGVPQR